MPVMQLAALAIPALEIIYYNSAELCTLAS
jgi:hypothetical protein